MYGPLVYISYAYEGAHHQRLALIIDADERRVCINTIDVEFDDYDLSRDVDFPVGYEILNLPWDGNSAQTFVVGIWNLEGRCIYYHTSKMAPLHTSYDQIRCPFCDGRGDDDMCICKGAGFLWKKTTNRPQELPPLCVEVKRPFET